MFHAEFIFCQRSGFYRGRSIPWRCVDKLESAANHAVDPNGAILCDKSQCPRQRDVKAHVECRAKWREHFYSSAPVFLGHFYHALFFATPFTQRAAFIG